MKAKGGKWTVNALQTFLSGPDRRAGGEDRADVVAYLKSVK